MRRPTGAGSAKPSPPMAALRKPSGSRASGGRQLGPVDGGLLDDDRVAGQSLGERGEHVPGVSGSPGAAAGRRRRPEGCGRSLRAPAPAGERSADRGRGRRQREVDGTAVRFVRVVGDDGDERALDEAARRRRRWRKRAPRRRGPVVGRERLAQPRSIGRQQAGEERDGPAGTRRARRRTPGRPERRGARRGRRARPSAPAHRLRLPRRAPAAAPARSAASSATAEASAERAQQPPGGGDLGLGGGLRQSSIGTITIAGPRPVSASCQARTIAPGTSWARTGWSTQTGYSPARPSAARPGTARDEVAPVLLADEDDERRAVDARGGERRRPRCPARRRVQERERGLAAADRPAGRDPDHRALVQREHEAEVIGQPARNGTSVEPGFEKIVVRPAAQDVEGRVPDRLLRGERPAGRKPQTSSATSTTRRSFAHCWSSVSALPSTVEEKPHCGERQSCSSGASREASSIRRFSSSFDSRVPGLVVTRPSTTCLSPFGQEAERLEAARALVVPFDEEAVDLELVEERLGDEVVAARGGPRGAEVAVADVRRDRHPLGPALRAPR